MTTRAPSASCVNLLPNAPAVEQARHTGTWQCLRDYHWRSQAGCGPLVCSNKSQEAAHSLLPYTHFTTPPLAAMIGAVPRRSSLPTPSPSLPPIHPSLFIHQRRPRHRSTAAHSWTELPGPCLPFPFPLFPTPTGPTPTLARPPPPLPPARGIGDVGASQMPRSAPWRVITVSSGAATAVKGSEAAEAACDGVVGVGGGQGRAGRGGEPLGRQGPGAPGAGWGQTAQGYRISHPTICCSLFP